MSDQTQNTEQQPTEQVVDDKKQNALAEHILRAAGLSGDDLMSFQHIFRDTAANLCQRLKLYTPIAFETDVIDLDTLNSADILPAIGTEGFLVTAEADRWGGEVYFILEQDLLSLATDAFFGAAEPMINNRNGRPISAVEQQVGKALASSLIAAMDDIFGNADSTLMQLTNAITANRFNTEEFEPTRMFSCNLQVKYNENAANLRILMPRSCHRPIQEAITRMLRTPSNRTDPTWAKRLRQEVSRAHVNIEAYMYQGRMSLEELTELSVGQVLPLPVNAVKQIRLKSADKPLYKCSLGKVGTNFSIRVSDPIDEEEEMIDELVHS